MPRPRLLRPLLAALESLWTPPRATTLCRIAAHRRQFEPWWKFELATHLWEFAREKGVCVFVESHDRADIALATPMYVDGAAYIDENARVCIPIELKTTGTWWGKSPSAIAKALQEDGRKRLADDFFDLAKGRRRYSPCGLVALLVTDAEGTPATLDEYAAHSKKLANHSGLHCVQDLSIELPAPPAACPTSARQLVWAAW